MNKAEHMDIDRDVNHAANTFVYISESDANIDEFRKQTCDHHFNL